jgi:hypothetical protein
MDKEPQMYCRITESAPQVHLLTSLVYNPKGQLKLARTRCQRYTRVLYVTATEEQFIESTKTKLYCDTCKRVYDGKLNLKTTVVREDQADPIRLITRWSGRVGSPPLVAINPEFADCQDDRYLGTFPYGIYLELNEQVGSAIGGQLKLIVQRDEEGRLTATFGGPLARDLKVDIRQ